MQSRSLFFPFGHTTQYRSFSDLHLVDTQDEGMYGYKSRDTWEGERP